ncbi:hypothetical protein SAMN06265222_10670 [Neorhodopirellula lusitana]|uniref:Uncharacterized protein n=1 Tax=Neorhodopirellula lusitana TaxID=445327 RepID=A0ABY1Q861_9BACT|nr:hypothetical protein SAMN06265222_10670 [Neorhodopirellula lusitana]
MKSKIVRIARSSVNAAASESFGLASKTKIAILPCFKKIHIRSLPLTFDQPVKL